MVFGRIATPRQAAPRFDVLSPLAATWLCLATDFFRHRQSEEIVKVLDQVGRQSGQHRQRVFDDWLLAVLATLSGGRMEQQYLQTIQPYVEGKRGKRPIDLFPVAFGELVNAMEETRADILGDIFEGAITRGQAGLFLTPETLCDLMAGIAIDGEDRTLNDPCCGSGRMFLAAAKAHPHRLWQFTGQDIDLRCVRITAINLALWNLYGWVLHGNGLKVETKLAYRTGFDGTGVVREVLPADDPALERVIAGTREAAQSQVGAAGGDDQALTEPRPSGRQLHLFEDAD